MKRFFDLMIKGCLIGVANLIPGVSGGTMAVVLGIYDQLIDAVQGLVFEFRKLFSHLKLLIPIGLGAIVAIFLGAQIMGDLIQKFPQATFMFFIGLILGSLPAFLKSGYVKRDSFGTWVFFGIGFLLVLWMSLFNPELHDSGRSLVPSFVMIVYLFFSGFIAAGTMLMPGVSGSFVLLIMGSYFMVLNAISSLNLMFIGVIGLGAVLGLLSMARVMEIALRRWPTMTHGLILGLVIGSVPAMWPGLDSSVMGLLAFVAGLGGFGLSFRLGR